MNMKRSSQLLILGLSLFLFLPSLAKADSIAVGVLSFDTFIPGGLGAAGTNAFDISNLTGAYALAPDFPVADSLAFDNASLILTLANGSTDTVALGNVGPGPLLDSFGNPLASLQFPDTVDFTGATFTATLSQTTFLLSDGSTVAASSPDISYALLPSSGSTLVADVDAGAITVNAAPVTATPEPATLLLLAVGMAGAFGFNVRRRRTQQS